MANNWDGKDFYATLKVSPDATEAEIKKSYRSLAKKYHPDMNKGDANADKMFKEVNEAYNVLKDSAERKKYDDFVKFGNIGSFFSTSKNPFNGGGSSNASGSGFNEFFDIHNLRHASTEEQRKAYREFYGYDDAPRPEDIDDSFSNIYNDIFSGLLKNKNPFKRSKVDDDFTVNDESGGDSSDPAARGDIVTIGFDEALKGTSVKLKDVLDNHDFSVNIPAGIENGQRIRIRGRGGNGAMGRGDLFVTVQVRKDPFFTRDGLDVNATVPITFAEAALGAVITVPGLYSDISMKVPAGVKSGSRLRLAGKGVKKGASCGDMFVEIQILPPEGLTEDQKNALKNMDDRYSNHQRQSEMMETEKPV